VLDEVSKNWKGDTDDHKVGFDLANSSVSVVYCENVWVNLTSRCREATQPRSDRRSSPMRSQWEDLT